MKRLVIVATRYRNDPEAAKIFQERNWRLVQDESTVPTKMRTVERKSHKTPLIDLDWEEMEYE